ncbi:MAG: hypothetical protein E6J71_16085 [Deltaproteobacteria bacterium]|nr:MAG: hypothetical protein E6J71_16085 [Deltaproteobacteria bacterium]
MLPSGNVIADPTFLTSATLANLFGPTAILALLAVLVALLVIFVGLIAEFRSLAALRRMASSARPPLAAPVESASRVASRQEAA